MLVLCKWCCEFILEGELFLHTCMMLAPGRAAAQLPQVYRAHKKGCPGY